MIKFLTIFLMIISITCNSNKQKTDNDVVPDPDITPDTETIDETTDKTSEVPDETVDEEPDEVPVVECLDLRVQENTIKTPFPFKDKNGRATFCRPGCDTPTENDPQCVRNIWEWDNWEKYQKYLEAQAKDPEQYETRECYPWPCKLPDMKAATDTGLKTPCDRDVTVKGYRALMSYIWTHGMSDGVVGMLLTHTHSGRAIEYDPEKDEYVNVGQARNAIYNKGRYIVEVYDQMPAESNFTNRQFVISIERRDGEYYYELIYDNKDHNAFFSRPPFVGKDWVLIQVREGKASNVTEVKYAKAGDWDWHSLNIGKVQEGNIVDDRLSFIIYDGTNERQIFYCDMSKHPKSFHECTRVTRKLGTGGYELGHSPRIDEEDKNRLIYYIHDSNPPTIVEVKFGEGKEPVYKEIPVERRYQTEKVKGNMLMYTGLTDHASPSFMGCWYRFDKNKSYCPKVDWVGQDMLFPTFTGKWQIWRGSVSFTLRDWECYCDWAGVCPLEE